MGQLFGQNHTLCIRSLIPCKLFEKLRKWRGLHGSQLLCRYRKRKRNCRCYTGALDITCIQNGIPAFMLKPGEVVDQNENVKIAEPDSNTMKLLSMVSGDIRKPEEKQIYN